MKKFVLSIFLVVTATAYAQFNTPSGNRFADSQSVAQNNATAKKKGPGNPHGGKDLPIDGYIPLLAISAVAKIIGYKKREKLHN